MGMEVEIAHEETPDKNFEDSQVTVDDVLAEMLQMKQALPARPACKQVEGARDAITNADNLLLLHLSELFSRPKPELLPTSVFRAFQEMREEVLRAKVEEQKRPWQAVLTLEDRHRHYENLIQRVKTILRSPSPSFDAVSKDKIKIKSQEDGLCKLSSASLLLNEEAKEDHRYLSDKRFPSLENRNSNSIVPLRNQGTLEVETKNPFIEIVNENKRTSVIAPRQKDTKSEGSSADYPSSASTESTNLYGPSFSSINRLTHSSSSSSSAFEPLTTIHEDGGGNQYPPKLIGILGKAVESQPEILDLSGNHFEGIVAFPESIGLLTSLTTLRLSGTQIQILPESIGALTNLVHLELDANQLRELPESLGCLSFLKVLNVEKNMIEELPWTIGHCTALEELRADFNQLKALPEALGKLSRLRCLSVHLNNLQSLPSTVGNLKALEELDIHFNQLNYVPESLCSLPSLQKLDLSSNFTELRALPESIGDLQSLMYLNISYNHITMLPDSFARLTNLSKLELDGNPFRDPPLHITHKGKEAILDYMKEKLTNKEREKTSKLKKGVLYKLAAKLTSLVKRHFSKKDSIPGLNVLA